MGDRANVHVIDGESKVYLYSHWSGPYVAIDTQEALSHSQRWDDGPYLARIIFETMLRGATSPFTGFGISSTLTDNQYPIVHVDVVPQLIHIGKKKWTFEEFTESDKQEILDAMETESVDLPEYED